MVPTKPERAAEKHEGPRITTGIPIVEYVERNDGTVTLPVEEDERQPVEVEV